MPNGIHTVEEVIEYLAESFIWTVGWEECGQKYFMAEKLDITVNELEAVCEYLNIDLENDFVM